MCEVASNSARSSAPTCATAFSSASISRLTQAPLGPGDCGAALIRFEVPQAPPADDVASQQPAVPAVTLVPHLHSGHRLLSS